MTKRTTKTAAELMAELNADPMFVARRREQEQAQSKMAVELRREAAPVIAALKNVGVDVESVWDLAQCVPSYPRAIPVLLEHLQRPYSSRLRESIARALAVPDAIAVWGSLLHLFETEVTSSPIDVKWAIGCAIAAAASDDVIADVIRLLHDRKHGTHRIALISALARSADPRARQAMTAAANDLDLAHELNRELKNLGKRKSVAKDVGAWAARRDLVEASTNLDANQVGMFLRQVAGLVDGVELKDIEKITHAVDELEVDSECELAFTVAYDGQMVPLHIHIVMDDIDSPDVYFFTTASLADRILEAMRDFSEEQEM